MEEQRKVNLTIQTNGNTKQLLGEKCIHFVLRDLSGIAVFCGHIAHYGTEAELYLVPTGDGTGGLGTVEIR